MITPYRSFDLYSLNASYSVRVCDSFVELFYLLHACRSLIKLLYHTSLSWELFCSGRSTDETESNLRKVSYQITVCVGDRRDKSLLPCAHACAHPTVRVGMCSAGGSGGGGIAERCYLISR